MWEEAKNTANYLLTMLALPKRNKQHDSGQKRADDAVEARGGHLRLCKMGRRVCIHGGGKGEIYARALGERGWGGNLYS